VVAAVSLDRQTRNQLGRDWRMAGMVYVEQQSSGADSTSLAGGAIGIDTASTREWAGRIERWMAGRHVRGSTDTMDDYAAGLLACPRLSLLQSATPTQIDSLATLCNRR
jgi:hypothetical protein